MPLPSRLIPSTPAALIFHHCPSPPLPPISSSLCPPLCCYPAPARPSNPPAVSPPSLPSRAAPSLAAPARRGAVRWPGHASWISRLALPV
ncbi:unnamed protein product [Urochloa decumbens]|uniref:Uncharacterized protein n=1 Tax=Urochloa decumbens TaxID=240449 RepID=A0ABC9GEG5_9POAL